MEAAMAQTDPGHLFEVKFPVTYSVVIAIIIIVMAVGYWFVAKDVEKTALFFAAAVTAGAVVTSTFFTARTLQAFIRQASERRQRENDLDNFGMRLRAMAYGERWNDATMFHVREVCRAALDEVAEGGNIIEVTKGKETNVSHLLNFFEEIGLAIDDSLADEELLRRQFSGLITPLWRTLFPWVQIRRKKFNDDSLWVKVQWLSERWHR